MASRPVPPPDDDFVAATAGAAALRTAAAVAIAALGDEAGRLVPIGSLAVYGARLGWPDWLYTGSSHAGRAGPPPPQITTADDLIISANLFAHVGAAALVQMSVGTPQAAAGPVARLALASAPTPGAVFEHLRRLMCLSGPHCRPLMGIRGESAFIELTGSVPLGGLLDYLGLLFIAYHFRVIEDLLYGKSARATISLTFPEGPESDAIQRLFGCEVRLGADTNCLLIPAAWLDLANPGHDPQLWALATERLRAAETLFQDSDAIRRLRRRIADMLTTQRQAPRLKQVAQAEGVSTRSLVRHIAAAGHSFHGLVDHERRNRAAHLIADPALSIRAIAEQLGFPDVSSFGRKFRHWFGDSPGRFRRGSM